MHLVFCGISNNLMQLVLNIAIDYSRSSIISPNIQKYLEYTYDCLVYLKFMINSKFHLQKKYISVAVYFY